MSPGMTQRFDRIPERTHTWRNRALHAFGLQRLSDADDEQSSDHKTRSISEERSIPAECNSECRPCRCADREHRSPSRTHDRGGRG